MAVYFCKCGRQVNKSTNADNTGNRDTAQCTGCPYLLPWGPDKYIEGQGFRKEVQGFECRMSPTISYTTTYNGQANDKCTLHILSLDLDFLDTVQAWIDDHAADTLSAGFSRGSMRGTDFSNKGRYSLSISCAQNKKGIAAKAALIEQFFTGGRVRKDMTLAQEKAHILAAIKRGKENASKMNYIISEHQNGLMYAYYKERFWFWHKDQNKWVPSAFATQQYDKAKAKDSGITPEMLLDNGSFNVLEEYQVPLQRRTALEALTPADSQVPAPDDREITKAPPAAAPASAEPPLPMPGDVYQAPQSGQLYKIGELTNGKKTCYLTMRSNAQGGTWVPANSSVYPNLSDAQGEFEAWIRREQLEPVAPTMDAAAITDELAAKDPFKAEETSITSASGADAGTSLPGSSCKSATNFSPAPASPADAGVAAQNLCAAEPASLEAKDINVPAFDYSGLDDQTVADLHLAEREYMRGRKLAEVGLRRMADGVAMAHDALCCTDATNCRNGDGRFIPPEHSFGAWCDSVGLNRKAAERLLQVARLFDNSTPREEKVLEELGPSLLYAAAKPSAPDELVQAVKDGDITSHKQYQDALAEIRARDAKIKDLLEMSEAADRRADAAQTERDAADARARVAEKERDEACKERDGAKIALQASKLRGDRLKAENDDLKARPIEVPAVDEEEIDRRVNARLQQAVYASQEERRQINARNAEDAILLLGRQINTAWQMVRPFLAEMEESRRVEAIDRINREWAQTQKEIMQCL